MRLQLGGFPLLCLLAVSSGAQGEERMLLAHWTLDDGDGGELVNDPQFVQGVCGRAMSFAGKEDKFSVPHSDAIDVGREGESYSVSFWFRSEVLPKDPPDAHFLTKFGDPYPFSFVQVNNGFIQFRTYDGKICSIIDSTMDLCDGNWHFIVGVRDGERKRQILYVDGFLASSGRDGTEGDLRNRGVVTIGRSHGDDFHGVLDEIQLYRGNLDRSYIAETYLKLRPPRRKSFRGTPSLQPKKAKGTPAMRQRMDSWAPTLQQDQETRCIEGKNRFVLKNDAMLVVISKETGEIVSLDSNGSSLLSEPGGVSIRDVLDGVSFGQKEGQVKEARGEKDTVTLRKTYEAGYEAVLCYKLGRDALSCSVTLTTEHEQPREARMDFHLPAISMMSRALWPRHGAPFDLAEVPMERIVYRHWDFRTAMILPFLCFYDPNEDVGVSFVSPFDLPKPGLSFLFDKDEGTVTVTNAHLRLSREDSAKAALYIVPHQGCWRPSLAWMLKTYPAFFRPGTPGGIETPGAYWLGSPYEDEAALKSLSERGCTWFQVHGHFPFYGLYMPEEGTWEAFVGLADQGKGSLEAWEKGEPQGGPSNSYDKMRQAIALRQKHGMQAFLYFQSFELWTPYAEKYYADDIGRTRNGSPLAAWTNCRLMNPDPAFAWGKRISAQILRVPRAYPDLEGLFYDRDDYRDYDYAHDDGVTMMLDTPCYMLGFAQQQINEVVTTVLRRKKMGIWTNGPTSVEVCKHIDGIMSEAVPQAHCHKYLGLARPMVLLPYFHETKSYDTTPAETEEKLKVALATGFFPCLTYGDDECRAMDKQYRPLFDRLKDREWVLNAHALELPEGMDGNIFKSSEGDYVVTVVDMKKPQLSDAIPSKDLVLEIRVPDAAEVTGCNVLSPQRERPQKVQFARKGQTLRMRIPGHFTASMVVFTK